MIKDRRHPSLHRKPLYDYFFNFLHWA